MLDPAYTTMDPSGLYVTTAGLALDAPGAVGVLAPILYDPAIMSSPWTDGNGVLVAAQADGSIVPVAVPSEFIDSGGLPVGVTNVLASGVQAAGSWLQQLLNPSGAVPVAAVGTPVSPFSNPLVLVALGVGAYFLLRKR